MENLEKRTVRKEIPHEDPSYLEARRRSQGANSDSIFGRSAASILDSRKQIVENGRSHIDKLKASLAGADQERSQYISGLIEEEQKRVDQIDREKMQPLRDDFNRLTKDLYLLVVASASP